jgi:hypothetical protein
MDLAGAEAGAVSDGYLGNERLNELARLCMALMREIWLLRDRQMVLERLLSERNLIDPDVIDAFEPDQHQEERIRLEVDRLLERVFASTFRTGPPDLDELTRRVHAELAAETKLKPTDPTSV